MRTGLLLMPLFAALFALSGCVEEPEVNRECSIDDPLPCPEDQVCVQGRCEDALGEGDSCGIGGTATGSIPCADGLVCRDDGSGNTTCQTEADQGTACTLDSDCGDLVCRRRTVGADTTCEAPAAFGAYCDTTEDCESGLECIAEAGATMKTCN